MLDRAVQFQGQHKKHADLQIATVKKLGGTPPAESARYEFRVDMNCFAVHALVDALLPRHHPRCGARTVHIYACWTLCKYFLTNNVPALRRESNVTLDRASLYAGEKCSF